MCWNSDRLRKTDRYLREETPEKYKNKMDGDTENKIINGNREDVKEKQEELKDNVRGVGRSVDRVSCEPCF